MSKVRCGVGLRRIWVAWLALAGEAGVSKEFIQQRGADHKGSHRARSLEGCAGPVGLSFQ